MPAWARSPLASAQPLHGPGGHVELEHVPGRQLSGDAGVDWPEIPFGLRLQSDMIVPTGVVEIR